MKKKLIVIGGGVAGHQIAHDLKDVMDVTLIDPKQYWEVPMAFPRLLVEPGALPARMGFKSFLGDARHVQGRAVGITDKTVEVELEGAVVETLAFDFAVIATGSRYRDPLVKAEAVSEAARAAEIETAHRRIKEASEVVVVGGGPVGVEVTAELRETFPSLQVTLIHAAERLLETAPNKFAGWAKKSLTDSGAKVILGDEVVKPAIGEQPADGLVHLKSGRSVKAGVVVWAVGTRPNTEFIRRAWPTSVQPDGLLKTDEFLRLEGHRNIFVAGDVTNLPEGRLAIVAGFHIPSIVANLKTLAGASPAHHPNLKPYKPAIRGKGMGKMMIVTLGRRDGLSSLPFGQFRASFIARKIKSETMFVPKSRKDVGL